jgi:two-component system sensor histidine kinase AlgZ
MVLAVVLLAELVALALALARQALVQSFWIDLAACSMFLLWLGLGCTAVLCQCRPWLARLTTPRAIAAALALLTITVMLISELVYRVGTFREQFAFANTVFPRDHRGFVLRTGALGFIVSALALRYFYVAAEWKRSVQQEAAAQIRALQARIRPHFLFNSMNTIAALTRSDAVRAEAAVEDLADLFRATLHDSGVQITLGQEIEVARTHERIEKLRLGERLAVTWDIDELPLRALVPSLLIQPLLENAVYHGIEPLPQGGRVQIVGHWDGQRIDITVRNPLPEPSSSAREASARDGQRMALENIRQRLELAWPGQARLDIQQQDGEFCARLAFPYSESPIRHQA